MIVELPDHTQLLVHRHPVDDEDNLVNHLLAKNQEFREMLAHSLQSGTQPFVRKTKPARRANRASKRGVK